MKTLTLILFVLMLTGCSTVKEKTGAVGKFIDAIGSGDVSFIKTMKGKQSQEDDEKAWEGDALYHPDSRAAFFRLLHLGYTDALRTIHPSGEQYSFWDYQAGAWPKNNGIRIDHLLLSPEAANRLQDAAVDRGPRGLEKASDHTPVWCRLS